MRSRRVQGVYVISVAAQLAGMHPQTLREYERKGLVDPSRTAGNTRYYSDHDIELLREIHRLTQEEGLNLAGAALVMELRRRLDDAQARIRQLEDQLEGARASAQRAVVETRRKYRHELVIYQPPAKPARRDD